MSNTDTAETVNSFVSITATNGNDRMHVVYAGHWLDATQIVITPKNRNYELTLKSADHSTTVLTETFSARFIGTLKGVLKTSMDALRVDEDEKDWLNVRVSVMSDGAPCYETVHIDADMMTMEIFGNGFMLMSADNSLNSIDRTTMVEGI